MCRSRNLPGRMTWPYGARLRYFCRASSEKNFATVTPIPGRTGCSGQNHVRDRRKAMGSEAVEAMALFGFLAVSAVVRFSFIAVVSWSDHRRRERESYYHNDMLKKLAESSGAGASAALELLREDARLRAPRKRQDMKVGGVVRRGGHRDYSLSACAHPARPHLHGGHPALAHGFWFVRQLILPPGACGIMSSSRRRAPPPGSPETVSFADAIQGSPPSTRRRRLGMARGSLAWLPPL